jgi:Nucleotidyltransferase domain
MHIYAFGSVCRGETDVNSDIDLLALVDAFDPRFDPAKYSIYSYSKMKKLWEKGSPFAWHLSIESRILYASDGADVLRNYGLPAVYMDYVKDCEKFFSVFLEARSSLMATRNSRVFDLSSLFLSIRNISTCFSLGPLNKPNFSRNIALQIGKPSLPLSLGSYRVLERSRILCTRGVGADISGSETESVLAELGSVEDWMTDIVEKARDYDRV